VNSTQQHDLNVFNQASCPMPTLSLSWASFTVFPSFFFLQLWPSFLKYLSTFRSKRKSEPPEIGNTCQVKIRLEVYTSEKLREKKKFKECLIFRVDDALKCTYNYKKFCYLWANIKDMLFWLSKTSVTDDRGN
jgi:hypothetical protein